MAFPNDAQIWSANEQWLEYIMKAGKSKVELKTQIMHKVPVMLRGIEENKDCFDPIVVSIGPYHHGKPELKLMEEYKVKMVWPLFNGDKFLAQTAYAKIKKVAREARNWYAEDSTKEFDEEKFIRMMFLDGCFVLQFIHCIVNNKKDLNMKDNMKACVLRDLLLLENQLPYQLLRGVMISGEEEEWKKMFTQISEKICGPTVKHSLQDIERKKAVESPRIRQLELEHEPAHLLEIVRTHLVYKNFSRFIEIKSGPLAISSGRDWYSYRSAKQLRTTGIRFMPSDSRQFTDIHFKSTFLNQVLTLPPLIIDETTKSFLLNMAAYEACPDGPEDAGVSSYICFMDSLIDDVEDVKELRSNGILHNFLGNDQQVADLYNQIAINLVPNPNAYFVVKKGVEEHHKNKIKVWLSQWLHKNFTFIAFFAGASALVLSAIQTGFTVYSTYKK